MPIKVLGLLHSGVRIPPGDDDVTKARSVYGDLLGLEVDGERPHIPEIPGFWVNLHAGDRGQQIHVFGADGQSPRARSATQDPTRPHLAFAVEDIVEAHAELTSRGIELRQCESSTGAASLLFFFEDALGNMIQLPQSPS